MQLPAMPLHFSEVAVQSGNNASNLKSKQFTQSKVEEETCVLINYVTCCKTPTKSSHRYAISQTPLLPLLMYTSFNPSHSSGHCTR